MMDASGTAQTSGTMGMDRFPKRRIAAITALFVVIVLVGLGVMILLRSQTAEYRIEKWLGARIPPSASDFHYWYSQAPGYYQANLYVRFKVSKDDFVSLVRNLGITKLEDPTSVPMLPTNFNSDPTVYWWNPPKEQSERFFLKTNNAITVNCLWSDGYAYIEKTGAFGGAWNVITHGAIKH